MINLKELDENLKNANRFWRTDTGYALISNRRRIGRLIVLTRRVVCKAVRILCRPLLDHQTEFNASVVRCLNEYRKTIDMIGILKEKFEEELSIFKEKLEEELEAEKIKNRRSKEIRTGIAYKKFEDQMRGTRQEIKERLNIYENAIQRVKESNGCRLFALDLGCGRGEWLELLQDRGITALGVDKDESMIHFCKKRRLDVVKNDLFIHLKNQSSNSVDILTAFQVVEHLHENKLVDVLNEAYRVLRPGGVMILETPNPENLIVGACNFYLDPTHVQKIPPKLLQTLVEDAGLTGTEIIRLHPYPGIDLSKADKNGANYALIEQMAVFFNSCVDYAITAYKKENGETDENTDM